MHLKRLGLSEFLLLDRFACWTVGVEELRRGTPVLPTLPAAGANLYRPPDRVQGGEGPLP